MSYNNINNNRNNIYNINDEINYGEIIVSNDEDNSTNNIPRHWLNLSLESCLIEAKDKLQYNEDNNNNDNVLNIIDALLSVVKLSPQASLSLLQEIAILTRDLTNVHSNITHILLVHLSSFPVVLPFIDIVPSMFCVSNTNIIGQLMDQLETILDSDYSLLLPIIGAMVDLPLSNLQSNRLAYLAESALSIGIYLISLSSISQTSLANISI